VAVLSFALLLVMALDLFVSPLEGGVSDKEEMDGPGDGTRTVVVCLKDPLG